MQACWYMILFPSKGFLLLCMHVLRRRAGRVASHRMALPAQPVVLIPSLAFKKLACSKESFSSRGAVKDRANRWWGCCEKRNDGDSYRTVHLAGILLEGCGGTKKPTCITHMLARFCMGAASDQTAS
ncbi:hypothetical protein PVAP13_9NG736054 [Panicum virgatum]|uniref:Secreted protein n=1 Tax=Panicum virgatum TaxID=38727 RepID=A0A8T0N254_PANVG|nr:hypothetical protein PVAP13_9NG736054 [Panicum virgatum]